MRRREFALHHQSNATMQQQQQQLVHGGGDHSSRDSHLDLSRWRRSRPAHHGHSARQLWHGWAQDEPAAMQAFLRAYAQEAFRPPSQRQGRPSAEPSPVCEPLGGPSRCLHRARGPDHVTTRGKFGRIKKARLGLARWMRVPCSSCSCRVVLGLKPTEVFALSTPQRPMIR
jgi:hypothetical protein